MKIVNGIYTANRVAMLGNRLVGQACPSTLTMIPHSSTHIKENENKENC